MLLVAYHSGCGRQPNSAIRAVDVTVARHQESLSGALRRCANLHNLPPELARNWRGIGARKGALRQFRASSPVKLAQQLAHFPELAHELAQNWRTQDELHRWLAAKGYADAA